MEGHVVAVALAVMLPFPRRVLFQRQQIILDKSAEESSLMQHRGFQAGNTAGKKTKKNYFLNLSWLQNTSSVTARRIQHKALKYKNQNIYT